MEAAQEELTTRTRGRQRAITLHPRDVLPRNFSGGGISTQSLRSTLAHTIPHLPQISIEGDLDMTVQGASQIQGQINATHATLTFQGPVTMTTPLERVEQNTRLTSTSVSLSRPLNRETNQREGLGSVFGFLESHTG